MLATIDGNSISYHNGDINVNGNELTSQITNLVEFNPPKFSLGYVISDSGSDIDITYESVHEVSKDKINSLKDGLDYVYDKDTNSFSIKTDQYLSMYLAYDDIAISSIQLFGPNGLNVPNIIIHLDESNENIWDPSNSEYNLTIKCIYLEFNLTGDAWSDPVKKVIEVENFNKDIFSLENTEYVLRLINILMFKLTKNG